MNRSVVVTGASSGIGRACVDELVRSGFMVWAAVRKDEDEAALRSAHPDAVQVLRLDLSDPASIEAAGKRVLEAGPLYGLVNNAGVNLRGPLEYLPIDVLRRQLDINIVGQLAVTQAMLPALRLSGDLGEVPRIVMIGSVSGRIAVPMMGAYNTSKSGLVGLTDSLRAELAPFGIRVLLIEPGAVTTPVGGGSTAAEGDLQQTTPEAAERYAKQIAAAQAGTARRARRGITPEKAAQVISRSLTAPHPRPRRVVGAQAVVTATLVRLLPHRLQYRITAAR